MKGFNNVAFDKMFPLVRSNDQTSERQERMVLSFWTLADLAQRAVKMWNTNTKSC